MCALGACDLMSLLAAAWDPGRSAMLCRATRQKPKQKWRAERVRTSALAFERFTPSLGFLPLPVLALLLLLLLLLLFLFLFLLCPPPARLSWTTLSWTQPCVTPQVCPLTSSLIPFRWPGHRKVDAQEGRRGSGGGGERERARERDVHKRKRARARKGMIELDEHAFRFV